MADEAGDDITDAHLVAAQKEADEAEALVSTLEGQIADGDETVTIEQVEAQESLSRFARLRVEATRKKLQRAKAKQRLGQANALRAEIDEYTLGIGKRLADKMGEIQKKQDELVAIADEHDAKVRDWRARAGRLDIPVSDGRPVPAAEDGRLAIGKPHVDVVLHAGRRRLTYIHGSALLSRFQKSPHPEEVIASTASIDAEVPEPTAQHFYRGENGAVLATDKPYTDAEIRRHHLTVISRKDAWGE